MAGLPTGYLLRGVFERKVVVVGAGLFLVIVGAMLTFAVKDDLDHINLPVAGLILMLAGAAVIAHARATAAKERVVTVREESGGPDASSHVVEETVRERRTD